eukprot:3264496-Pyramimonas_sp.AAC.1
MMTTQSRGTWVERLFETPARTLGKDVWGTCELGKGASQGFKKPEGTAEKVSGARFGKEYENASWDKKGAGLP